MEECGTTTMRRSDETASAMRADSEAQDLFVELIRRKDSVRKEIAKVAKELRQLKEQHNVLLSLDPGSGTEIDGKNMNNKKQKTQD